MKEDKASMVHRVASEITKELMDEGKLIEAGFATMRHLAIRDDASMEEVEAMRLAYMAGAEHLFRSMMVALDPGDEPTEADMRRLELIGNELDEWRGRLSAWVRSAKGTA